jgi:hypothetical protein
MNSRRPDPPKVGIWLLRHFYRGAEKDALTGDLIERFPEGQTRGCSYGRFLLPLEWA